MSELLRFFKDMRDNGYGLAEIAAQLGTSAIAEPVAGFAAMYDPQHGADAIREGMTYQPRSQAAQEYSQSVGNAANAAIKPAMPIIDAWKQGVDIAGQYSPVVGAMLRTVPTAIGIAMGAKPALQAGQQVSEGLGAMQGRMIANANAPSTLNTAGFRGQRGVFAGINALTADKEALAKAQQMIAQGVDPADVWKETGWGRGADGKWRFEINDKFDITDDGKEIGSSLNYNNGTLSQLANGQIGVARGQQLLNHDDLYAAYPDFKNMEIRNAPDGLGFFDNNNTVGVNNRVLSGAVGGRDLGRTNSAHSVLLHELQHAIQQREGFAKGGSPQTVNQSIFRENQAKYFDDLITQLEEKLPKPNQQWIDDIHDPIEAQIEKIKEQKYNLSNSNVGFDAYRSLAGEVEARTTQSRLNLDPQQRRENYPFDYKTYGYDVPAKSQIVDFGNNKANAQRPLTEFEQAHLIAQQNAALPVNQGGLGLAADNTAMDRARAMGFDVDNPVYHGTDVEINGFSKKYNAGKTKGAGFFFTDSPDVAATYTGVNGGNTIKALLRNKEPLNIDVKGGNWSYLKKDLKVNADEIYEQKKINKTLGKLLPDAYKYDDAITTDDLARWANNKGYSSVNFKDVKDRGGEGAFANAQSELPSNNTAIFADHNIRSVNAAFDPKNKWSSNLLAQSAKLAPTTALGAYMYNENRKKSQGKQ